MKPTGLALLTLLLALLPVGRVDAAVQFQPDSDVFNFGDAPFHGSTGSLSLTSRSWRWRRHRPVRATGWSRPMAATPSAGLPPPGARPNPTPRTPPGAPAGARRASRG